jgi:predicted DNA-binding protein (MmcQ/YjbR family)
MSVEEIRNYCLSSLKGTTESIKWDDHLCFSVGDKMYLVINPDKYPVSSSFKTTDTLFEELSAREGIIPAPYMARNKWVHVDDINRLTSKEWTELITIAYTLVLEKLSLKAQKLITGN